MEETLKKEIMERYNRLPKEIQGVLLSTDISNNLQEVVKRNRLLIDQAGKLEMETTLVLLGLEPLTDYTSNLSKELGVPTSTAISIANDVNELIFKNIRDALQKMNTEDAIMEEGEEDISLHAEPSSKLGAKWTTIPERDSLIAEIENPVPTKAVANVQNNLPQNVEAENTVQTKPADIATQKPALNILESKLQSETFLPRQEVKIEDKSKIPPKNDPYREPII